MVQDALQTSLNAFRHIIAERDEEQLGKLASIPRYRQLHLSLAGEARSCYQDLQETIENLGLAMQLGQHRRLIESLSTRLNGNSLRAMTAVSLDNSKVSSAFAVYLTTMEQAYHWPRNTQLCTPGMVEDHKLVIQMLNQPQLRELLRTVLRINTSHQEMQLRPEYVAQIALTLARSILDETRLKGERGETVSRNTQDIVNLLYRTCRNEWNDQGYDSDSHKEFGRLHEVIRASGTQRRMQELLEESQGLLCLQIIPSLLENLPLTSTLLSHALTQLQFAVAVAREDLFSVSVDEVIWGRAFANFSKAVGFSDLSAGGGDGPIFWMLDSLCGQARPKSSATLPEELNTRSRFFPQTMRHLVDRMHALPVLREYCKSPEAPEELKQSFKALERQRFELYNMHRKKAARIGVSLRAGQNGTSAGVNACAYSSPEQSLAQTLSSAVSARFGDNDDSLSIDAIAQAHTLIFDDDTGIYSARVRFTFSTPLALGPGDTLLVIATLPDGQVQTRTYSTTYTRNTHRPLDNNAHEIVCTAEVYVRSKGKVSNYLCSQTQGCKVQVAVKPASHFRLSANEGVGETTVLVAQGGALGIFVAWLERQTQLVGKYVLIVAARKVRQIGFKNELLDLVRTFKQSLQVKVVLSKPEEHDISFLQSSGIEAYHGRIGRCLEKCSFSNLRAAFICGTSSFGLGVTRSMSLDESVSKPLQRLEPIITSHLPTIRLHVAPEPEATQDLPLVTKLELAQHNSPSDLWIAVGNNVYDITDLCRFHPGGEKILMARAGRQADDIFESVHGGAHDVRSLLENMIIGQLTSPDSYHSVWEDRVDRIVEIQNDLTNHTRFENLPGEANVDISKVPPTEVIYASLDCFASNWCRLLEEVGISRSIQCKLMRTCFAVIKELDNRQAIVYRVSFGDVQRCSQVLQEVFDTLRMTALDIHAELDSLKLYIAGKLLGDDCTVDDSIFEQYTTYVVAAIKA